VSPSADHAVAAPGRAGSTETGDAVALRQSVPLNPQEAAYVEAARAANTLRGYRFDWAQVHRLVHLARQGLCVVGR
jgi:hypothetical protein